MSAAATGYIQANTNGRLHDATVASLSPLNRSFLYGDAVYEVWRTYDQVVFAWEEHWQRLQKSAASVALELPWSAARLEKEIKATVAAFRQNCPFRGDLYIRLQIYRGAGPIGLDTNLAGSPGFVVFVKSVPELSTLARREGLSVTVAKTLRRNPIAALDPAWKTGNYLNNLLGLKEAHNRGADDVLFLNLTGEITEASTSNVAFIRDRQWVTPPVGSGILHGITRARIIAEVAAAVGLEPIEAPVYPADLATFAEAMLLSTTKDVQPVGRIDDHRFDVSPGARVWGLKDAFATSARHHAASHPEWRV